MTPDQVLSHLNKYADPSSIAGKHAYHKVDRVYLGTSNEVINDLAKFLRQTLGIEERVALAEALWDMDIFETRVAAAKLLTQARIKSDPAVWALITSWVPQFDSWAIADHVCSAGQKRLVSDPLRVDVVETWCDSPHMWTRRAAYVDTPRRICNNLALGENEFSKTKRYCHSYACVGMGRHDSDRP